MLRKQSAPRLFCKLSSSAIQNPTSRVSKLVGNAKRRDLTYRLQGTNTTGEEVSRIESNAHQEI
jgi:hypothetical protein